MLTQKEKALCANEAGVIFGLMTEEQKETLNRERKNGNVQVFTRALKWSTIRKSSSMCLEYAAYRINPGTKPDRGYAYVTVKNKYRQWWCYAPETEGTPLYIIAGRADFAGIRYEGRDDWLGVLDTVKYGKPVEVRFKNG